MKQTDTPSRTKPSQEQLNAIQRRSFEQYREYGRRQAQLPAIYAALIVGFLTAYNSVFSRMWVAAFLLAAGALAVLILGHLRTQQRVQDLTYESVQQLMGGERSAAVAWEETAGRSSNDLTDSGFWFLQMQVLLMVPPTAILLSESVSAIAVASVAGFLGLNLIHRLKLRRASAQKQAWLLRPWM